MTMPVHHGRGQEIDKEFKVKKLPRLIMVRGDRTVYKDVLFMKDNELTEEIDRLLDELPSEVEIDTSASE